MIVVKIEMYPHGDKEGSYPLGVITVTNDDTGTKTIGNYTYAISHGGRNCGGKKGVMKHGRIKGLNRNQKNAVYKLLAQVLKDAGFK